MRKIFVGFCAVAMAAGCKPGPKPTSAGQRVPEADNVVTGYVTNLQGDVAKARVAVEKANQRIGQTDQSVQQFQQENQ